MTTQEYISSGVLELYALGSVSANEMQDVEMMVSKFPEVKNALDEICVGIESYAMLHAVEPDEKIKENIFAEISAGKSSKIKSENNISENGKVISLQTEKSSRFKTWAIAASVFLVVSISINVYQIANTNALSKERWRLFSEVDSVKDSSKNVFALQQKTISQRDSILHVLDFVRNPMTQSIALESMIEKHPMKAVVHWNMKSMEVAVDPMTLPSTSDSTKYVFWAIVNGKPVNEGNFSMSDSTGIMMMKTIPQADAFAISLEKSASVESPAGPIYVMGKPAPSEP